MSELLSETSLLVSLYYISGQTVGTDEILERFAICLENGVLVPLPDEASGVQECDFFSYFDKKSYSNGFERIDDPKKAKKICCDLLTLT